MNIRWWQRLCIPVILGIALVSGRRVQGYAVGPAVSLDKMAEMADVIVHARAVATGPAADAWFKQYPGFRASATTLEVRSVLKGKMSGETLTFLHYTSNPQRGFAFMPQHYEFVPGRSYIVFAARTDTAGTVRQLWANQTQKEDQGALRVDDKVLAPGVSIKAACWSGLTGLLSSRATDDVIYALQQLDQMSGNAWSDMKDFAREEVAAAIRPLLVATNRDIALKAIAVAGSRNPSMGGDSIYWLAAGRGHLPGIGARNPGFDNVSGRVLWRDLVKVADSPVATDIRGAAIRALGRSRVPEVGSHLRSWCGDLESEVRAAAVVLLGDNFIAEPAALMAKAANDPAESVRKSAVQAIGFAARTNLIPVLGGLLSDPSTGVQDAAALNLLSLDVAVSGLVLREHVQDPEFHSLFANALASRDPAPYVADLQQIIVQDERPSRWTGGRIPAVDSWDILFKYMQSRPAEEMTAGRWDRALDALESLKWYGSSEPRDLYALYLQRGLGERAKLYRARCHRTFTYDIDYYFNMADRSPGTYAR